MQLHPYVRHREFSPGALSGEAVPHFYVALKREETYTTRPLKTRRFLEADLIICLKN